MQSNLKKAMALIIAATLLITGINFLSIQTVNAADVIGLQRTKKTIAKGKTCTLKIYSNSSSRGLDLITSCKWSSSDKTVAKVSQNGVVKGIKKGTATITCNLTWNKKENYTLKCKVTVKNTVPVTITGTEGKDPGDVEIISSLIREQIACGAEVSTDLNYYVKRTENVNLPHGYKWNEDGRLIFIGWPVSEVTGKLDVRKLKTLEELQCGYNTLTALKVNSKIQEIYCYNNRIKSLDVSNCKNLVHLSCGGNQITKLDVNNCENLDSLWCSLNQLTTLDVSRNISLRSLDCGGNKITILDVTKNSRLFLLDCSVCSLTTLDISKNPDLVTFNCGGNPLYRLDISNNSRLKEFTCENCQLTKLILGSHPQMYRLHCKNNKLTVLDISNCPALTDITVDDSVRIIN